MKSYNFLILYFFIFLITCISSSCDKLKTDANSAYTRRVLVIDLNENLGQNLKLDTLYEKYKQKLNNKLCFLEPQTKKLKIVDNKEQIDKGVFFNDILLIRVLNEVKYVDMLDEVKRRIFVRFEKNNSLLMADMTLYRSENKKPQKKYSSSRAEVDLNKTEEFLFKEIELILKLGIRDSPFR